MRDKIHSYLAPDWKLSFGEYNRDGLPLALYLQVGRVLVIYWYGVGHLYDAYMALKAGGTK